MAGSPFVRGAVAAAPFTLKVYRGEGMVLLAMNWKTGTPPADFVGFSIEYCQPGDAEFFPVKNRLHFSGMKKPAQAGKAPEQYPSTEAPFQTFRWVHFPRLADTPGKFTYRVTPKFMNDEGVLSAGVAQEVQLEIYSETDPGKFNIAFTRGYVSSQAFADKFGGAEGLKKLIPADADDGNEFTSTHKDAARAYQWMGFEARERILNLLDDAAEDGANVMVVAYELNLPEVIDRLAALGGKLRIIIDDSSNRRKKADGTYTGKDKGAPDSAESKAEAALKTAGAQVIRQHMGQLQHNKMIVVDGPSVKRVVLGSTNFSWRGLFVQSNNAFILCGKDAVDEQKAAFEAYWNGDANTFSKSVPAAWRKLDVTGLDADISMSPHAAKNSTQKAIANDVDSATSSLLFSLAFLNQTSGDVTEAVKRAINRADLFAYGISDKRTKIVLQQPDGNPAPVFAASLSRGLPEPFRSEASGGGGVKMHHKFIVIDFDKPTARVYTGSYNFSKPADRSNGENLLLIRDPRVATAYMVEALRIFDAYQFRVSFGAKKATPGQPKPKPRPKELKRPPNQADELPWWDKFWSEPIKKRDREMFA
jgi:phosphatidylserine/phosphatidylglycerophosphate/cardiolipin synthase-like enzyme